MFCAPGPVFGGTDGVRYRFHVLRSRTRFRWYRRRRVPFSCFTLPDPSSTVPRASGLVFMFCALGPVFGDTDGVWFRFLVLRSRTNFRRYRERRVRFSYFALEDSFSAVPWASGPVSCFALQDSFLAVPTTQGPVFMFCAPGIIFDGSDGVGSRFHVCAPGPIFGGTDGVGSRFYVLRSRTRFHVLRSWTHFWHYRGRRVPFSCFALPDPFSAVPTASGTIFMFCAPGLVFGGTDGVGSRFHVLRSWTSLRRYRGRRVSFSCLALPDPFSAIPTASDSVFLFYAPGLISDDTDGVGSRFYVLRSRTCFR
jgi:hypothetical protein